MKLIFSIILILPTFALIGQNGYIKLQNDSTLTGYLRYYTSIKDGHQGIEFWRTKKDKEPLKISKQRINEYAIKKDTFKVLHQFTPFPDNETFFEIVDAKLKSSGKINLYIIDNYQNVNRVSTYTGGGIIPAIVDESLGNYTYIYILEDKETGFLKALPSKREKLLESLADFFPEKYIKKYDEVKGKVNYRSVPALVKLYNSK
ncbi:hypothetical protein [Chryseolinea sp. H1M3-3]|uniref:hypothetical protein n=1 Tax=Chryseolinea sp. H1M3-3 TaxID=3034144 RepID=UPI0023EB877C|nr:hypothetical protein [Chryseolinea sp. H1M3-3]